MSSMFICDEYCVGVCCTLILQGTDGELDILDNVSFARYKRYFD